MKVVTQIYILAITLYIVIYKIFITSFNDVMNYIINTLIWVVFLVLGYVFLYNKNKRYYKYEKDVIYITVISALLYVLLFYSLGFIVGFSKNPYSKEISVIIINLFSIIFLMCLQEYIRGILVNEVLDKKYIYVIIITLIFVVKDLNLVMIANNLTNFNLFFIILVKSIIPILSINIFLTFLCIKGGVIPGIFYRLIITLPTILIFVYPKYDIIIPMLFDLLFPLFTYLIITYQINKKDKYDKQIIHKPSRWILTFLITIFLLMFSLGVFNIKPVVIISGSMKPNINVGDLLIIKSCQIEKVKVNDIVEFRIDNYNVVHRVIKKDGRSDGINLVTKGDNNINKDKFPVTKDNLIGCFKYRIPYIGYPAYLIRKLFTKNIDIETGR